MTLDLLAIICFSCGAMLGFLVTALLPHRDGVWWLWPGVRVAWQLGGGLWCGAAVGDMMQGAAPRGLPLLICGGLGAVLCANALLDLVRGPMQVEGRLVAEEVQRGRLWVPLLVPHNPTIHGRLAVQDDHGQVHVLKTAGLQTNRLNTMMAKVLGAPRVRLRALRHLGAPLCVERLD